MSTHICSCASFTLLDKVGGPQLTSRRAVNAGWWTWGGGIFPLWMHESDRPRRLIAVSCWTPVCLVRFEQRVSGIRFLRALGQPLLPLHFSRFPHDVQTRFASVVCSHVPLAGRHLESSPTFRADVDDGRTVPRDLPAQKYLVRPTVSTLDQWCADGVVTGNRGLSGLTPQRRRVTVTALPVIMFFAHSDQVTLQEVRWRVDGRSA